MRTASNEYKFYLVGQALGIIASMAKEAYWQRAASPHCGADMTGYCVECQHYNMCHPDSNLKKILDTLGGRK